MNKVFIVVISLLMICVHAFATHNRAGEITYEHIEGNTYKFIVTTYTYTPSLANETRDILEVTWGDGTSSFVQRIEVLHLPNDYDRNVYEGIHTFPGQGIYEVVMEDPNRNYGVGNIPNSVNVPFSIKTTILIDPNTNNNTPVLLNPPYDKAAVGHIFIHNPSAFDPDGDSLSYKLTTCTGENGEEIYGYSLPASSNSFTVNAVTGDMIWDTPVDTGTYNVAMLIEEWRNGVKIGRIVRDMQIEVFETNNNPPEIEDIDKICVLAGDTINIDITATDPDNDKVKLTATGGVFQLEDSPASFITATGVGSVTTQFIWETSCSHVRRQNYHVTIKAEDIETVNSVSNFVSLVDQKSLSISVVAPEVENVVLDPTNNTINVSWDKSICENAIGYKVYRRTGYFDFIHDNCQTGVPSETGYLIIATVDGYNSNSYLDNNNGDGLVQGYEYCYIITAIYEDGAESYASEEVCTELVRGIPVITMVSVDVTDTDSGIIDIQWAKPTEFNVIAAPGPYKYLIYRSDDFWGENLLLIDSLDNINDTTFIDSLLNTTEYPYSYQVEFYNDEPGNRYLIGAPHIASSMFLNLSGGDNKVIIDIEKNVPWINDEYSVYRQNKSTLVFDSIGTTTSTQFVDTLLINEEIYCYKVRSTGGYIIEGIINPIINLSHENCEMAVDNEKPCAPFLNVNSFCDSLYNGLTWTNPNNSCADDVVKYNIYYKETLGAGLILLDSVLNSSDTTYMHFPLNTIAACYLVTAVDSFDNESSRSNVVCVDDCSYYELPNVFTPNGDGINDLFKPGPYYFVDKVDFKIFNRWGNIIFTTEDPDINWDGRYMENNKIVSTGVYYYMCDVYEYRLSGIEPRTIVGFVHVFTTKDGNVTTD